MYTRKQYMNNEVSHEDYYAQFGKHLMNVVRNNIGIERILKSTDEHFNDIPLKKWKNLQHIVLNIVGHNLSEANSTGGVSLSDCVCTVKSAATLLKQEYEELTNKG